LVAVVAGYDEVVAFLNLHVMDEVEPDGHLRTIEGRLLDVADG
jgi:hypothetical protein